MPQTVEDLGKLVKAKHPGSYDDLPDVELGRKVKAKFPGSYGDFVDVKTEGKTWSDKLGLQNPIARAVVDAGEGAVSGAATTAHTITQVADVAGGGPLIRKVLGQANPDDDPRVQAVIKQATTAPDTVAGKAGRFGEQVAEMVIPAGIAGRAAKGLSMAARMVTQGAAAAGVAGLQTGGDPTAMGTAAVLGGASEAIPAAMAQPGVANFLKESAAKTYGRVLNTTKQGNKWLSQNVVVPGLLDRGVRAASLKGLLKGAGEKASFYGDLIGDAWKNLPAGTKTALDPIIDSITQKAEGALTVADASGKRLPVTEYAKSALGQAEFMKDALKSVAEVNPVTKALEVPVEKLRMLRQAWDEVASNAQVFQGKHLADHVAGKVHAMASDSIREVLAQEFPTISALNKEYSFWKNVQKVVGDTVLRREGQAKPMSQQIASAAGTAAGYASGGFHGAVLGKYAMDMLQKVTSSAAWGTVSAVAKDRLADAIATGNRASATVIIAKMLKSVGLESATKAVAAPEQSSGKLLLPSGQ